MTEQAKGLMDAVVRWAEGRPDILGVALVGSYARDSARADSDVDLVILSQAPKELIDGSGWVMAFGNAKPPIVEDWGLVTSLRVFYDEGLEVEYGITSLEWATPPIDDGTRRVMADGMKILLDKSGLLDRASREIADKNGN